MRKKFEVVAPKIAVFGLKNAGKRFWGFTNSKNHSQNFICNECYVSMLLQRSIVLWEEKKFLAFFFKRLKFNTSGAYQPDFPYVSPCGPEMNFVRCDDRPIVFTGIMPGKDGEDLLMYGHAGDLLTVNFQPEKLCMFPHSGRVYHPAMEKVGGIGLVKSSFSIELSKLFLFNDGENSPPTHFVWKDSKIKLTNELFSLIKKEELERNESGYT